MTVKPNTTTTTQNIPHFLMPETLLKLPLNVNKGLYVYRVMNLRVIDIGMNLRVIIAVFWMSNISEHTVLCKIAKKMKLKEAPCYFEHLSFTGWYSSVSDVSRFLQYQCPAVRPGHRR